MPDLLRAVRGLNPMRKPNGSFRPKLPFMTALFGVDDVHGALCE